MCGGRLGASIAEAKYEVFHETDGSGHMFRQLAPVFLE